METNKQIMDIYQRVRESCDEESDRVMSTRKGHSPVGVVQESFLEEEAQEQKTERKSEQDKQMWVEEQHRETIWQ